MKWFRKNLGLNLVKAEPENNLHLELHQIMNRQLELIRDGVEDLCQRLEDAERSIGECQLSLQQQRHDIHRIKNPGAGLSFEKQEMH